MCGQKASDERLPCRSFPSLETPRASGAFLGCRCWHTQTGGMWTLMKSFPLLRNYRQPQSLWTALSTLGCMGRTRRLVTFPWDIRCRAEGPRFPEPLLSRSTWVSGSASESPVVMHSPGKDAERLQDAEKLPVQMGAFMVLTGSCSPRPLEVSVWAWFGPEGLSWAWVDGSRREVWTEDGQGAFHGGHVGLRGSWGQPFSARDDPRP